MTSTVTAAIVLIAFGSLSLVTARPAAIQVSKDIKEQAEAATVNQIIDAYKGKSVY